MGRKAIPAHLHLVNGNPSKLRLAALVDGSRIPIEIPEMPPHLDKNGKAEWERITFELAKLGLIARVDRAAIAIYCEAYSRWQMAAEELNKLGKKGFIEKTPSGYKQMSVWLQISNRAADQMQKIMGEFGMTASSRSKVSINLQNDLFPDTLKNAENQPAASADPADKYFGKK